MTTKHDLIFFENRSTPKVIAQGQRFIAPESYGKQTNRRPATEAEEKQIANGQWIRVDEHGNKGGDPNYKETRMAGREHLVHQLTEDSLAQSGVKGMKWGVRHDPGHEGETAKTKTIAKADANFEKSIARVNSGKPTLAFNNAVVSRLNSRISELNDSPKYRGENMLLAKGAIAKSYEKDLVKLSVRSFEDGTREVYGSNASGTKKGVYNPKTDQIDIVDINAVKHADNVSAIPDVTVYLKRNNIGQVESVTVGPLDSKSDFVHGENMSREHLVHELTQAVLDAEPVLGVIEDKPSLDDALQHYGKKGMKWGQRSQNRLDRLNRVNDGKASFKDKLIVSQTETSPIRSIRRGGAKKDLLKRAATLEQRKARVEAGKATIRDYMALHGADRIVLV